MSDTNGAAAPAPTGNSGQVAASPGNGQQPTATPAQTAAPAAQQVTAQPTAPQPGLLGELANQQQAQPAQPMTASPYPDNLPERFRGANERETIEKLTQEVLQSRQPPGKATDYQLVNLPDNVVKQFGDLKDDPVLPIFQKAAHKAGLTQDQYQSVFVEMYAQMQDAGLIEPPFDVQAEFSKLSTATDPLRRKGEALGRLSETTNWVKGLQQRGVLTQEQAAVLSGNAATANGVMMIEALMKLTQPAGIQTGGQPVHGGIDLKSALTDPRYSSTSPQYDPAFRARVDEMGRQKYANGRAG